LARRRGGDAECAEAGWRRREELLRELSEREITRFEDVRERIVKDCRD
jgi:hypothetical protein